MHRAVALLLVTLALPLSAEVFAPPVPVTSTLAEDRIQWLPSLSVNGGRPLVVWTDWPRLPYPLIGWHGTLRAAAGTLPAPQTNTVTLFSSAFNAYLEPLADGSTFAAWVADGGLFAGRISGEANIVSGVQWVAREAASVAVGSSNDKVLLVWMEHPPSRPKVMYGALFDRQGQLLGTPFEIARPTQFNIRTDIASDGTNFLVVWSEDNGDGNNPVSTIWAVRVDGTGAQQPGINRVIATEGNRPAVASNGRDYAVVWIPNRNTLGLRGRRVAADGSPYGNVATIGSGSEWSPQIAWDGWGYTIAFLANFEAVTVVRYNANLGQATPLGAFPAPYAGDLGLRVADGVAHLVWTHGYRIYYTSGKLPAPPAGTPGRRRSVD